jgi:hypothetical protein
MFKLIKLAVAGVVVIVLLVVVVLVGAFMYVDSIARQGIERGGTYALGVPTEVRHVDVGLFRGRVTVDGLRIGNPQGFEAPSFLRMESGRTEVAVRTLRQDVVRVPQLRLSDVEVVLERRPGEKANYQVILDNLERFKGPEKPEPAPGTAEGKRVIVDELVLTNIRVHVDMLRGQGAIGEAMGQLGRVTVPIDEIRLTGVGQTGEGVAGSGVTLGELAGLVVQAVLGAAVEKGGDILPADLIGDVRSRLAQIGDLDEIRVQISGQLSQLGKAFEGIQSPEGVQEAIRKGSEGVERLRDLIPKR